MAMGDGAFIERLVSRGNTKHCKLSYTVHIQCLYTCVLLAVGRVAGGRSLPLFRMDAVPVPWESEKLMH